MIPYRRPKPGEYTRGDEPELIPVWQIRTHRTAPRWARLLVLGLEYICVATRHWQACRLLNGGVHPDRWHRFVNWAFEQADDMTPWRPL